MAEAGDDVVDIDLACPNCGVDLGEEVGGSDDQTTALIDAIVPTIRRRHQHLLEQRNEIQRELDRVSEMVDRAEARIEDVEMFQEFLVASGRAERRPGPEDGPGVISPISSGESDNGS